MKIDLEHVFLNDEGQPKKRLVNEENEFGLPLKNADGSPKLKFDGNLTLKSLLYPAVNAKYQGEDLKMDEVYARGKLARRIKSGGAKHFSSDDIKRMRECAERMYSHDPMLVLDIGEVIDPEHEPLLVKAEAADEAA